jgi:hypothetical protein
MALAGKFKHFCHEWDGLEIDETCPEFSCCSCFEPCDEITKIKDELWAKAERENGGYIPIEIHKPWD